MKELGEYIKEKRKEIGVGLEEAAEDLNLTKDDIENIEAGNIRAFRDVLKLKVMIKDYAKYLGLDSEKVVDEFNDFLFEHTSKISLDDIQKDASTIINLIEELDLEDDFSIDDTSNFMIETNSDNKNTIIVTITKIEDIPELKKYSLLEN